MSVTPLNNNVLVKADKTAVAKPLIPVKKTEPEIKKQEQHVKSPHSTESKADIECKVSKNEVKHNINLVEEEHEEHGVLGKAKEEAQVKACEKTAVHVSEHIAAKTVEKAAEKAIGQGAVAIGVEKIIESGAKRHAPQVVQKTSKVLAKGLAKVETNATVKSITGTTKAIAHGMEHNVEKVMKGTAKVADKLTANGFSRVAEKAIEKVGVKAAGRMAAFVPVAGIAVGAAITKMDYDDFKHKMKDPTVTKTSKVLAGVTVGLDALSTGASAVAAGAAGTVIGAPVAAVAEGISWVATGASILTSAGSEIFKHSGNSKHH